MGHVEAAHVSHVLSDGRVLPDDVSFRTGDGLTAALAGLNGAGKTATIRPIIGLDTPSSGDDDAGSSAGAQSANWALRSPENVNTHPGRNETHTWIICAKPTDWTTPRLCAHSRRSARCLAAVCRHAILLSTMLWIYWPLGLLRSLTEAPIVRLLPGPKLRPHDAKTPGFRSRSGRFGW